MRTTEEISDRYKMIQESSGPLDFRPEVLLQMIPTDHLNAVIPDALEKLSEEERTEWDQHIPSDDEELRAVALSYLAFAFGKAEDHRGISASRSVDKMGEYLWLLGLDTQEFLAAPYAMYGVPSLVVAARLLGSDYEISDTLWRMAESKPCKPGCQEGCIG